MIYCSDRAEEMNVRAMGCRRQALALALVAAFALFFVGLEESMRSLSSAQLPRAPPPPPSRGNATAETFRVGAAHTKKKRPGATSSEGQLLAADPGLALIERLEPKLYQPAAAMPNLPLKASAPRLATRPATLDLGAAFAGKVKPGDNSPRGAG
jgi:hypothetical protein